MKTTNFSYFHRTFHMFIKGTFLVLSLAIPVVIYADEKPQIEMKESVIISNHEESQYLPNVASFSDQVFEGTMHTFLFNGKLRRICEIRSSSRLVYFGAPCEFYVHSEGVVSGISHFNAAYISFRPSLHKDHEVMKFAKWAGKAYEPIVCSDWDEFVEAATRAGYFFPLVHFSVNTGNDVVLPKALAKWSIETTGNLFDGEISNAYVSKGKSLIVEGSAYGGLRKLRLELRVQDGSNFKLARAWKNDVLINLEE